MLRKNIHFLRSRSSLSQRCRFLSYGSGSERDGTWYGNNKNGMRNTSSGSSSSSSNNNTSNTGGRDTSERFHKRSSTLFSSNNVKKTFHFSTTSEENSGGDNNMVVGMRKHSTRVAMPISSLRAGANKRGRNNNDDGNADRFNHDILGVDAEEGTEQHSLSSAYTSNRRIRKDAARKNSGVDGLDDGNNNNNHSYKLIHNNSDNEIINDDDNIDTKGQEFDYFPTPSGNGGEVRFSAFDTHELGRMYRNFRNLGHLIATVNPLNLSDEQYVHSQTRDLPELQVEWFGFDSEKDKNRTIYMGKLFDADDKYGYTKLVPPSYLQAERWSDSSCVYQLHHGNANGAGVDIDSDVLLEKERNNNDDNDDNDDDNINNNDNNSSKGNKENEAQTNLHIPPSHTSAHALLSSSTLPLPELCDAMRTEMTLGDFHSLLRETFCGNVGFEYAHTLSAAERNWLTSRAFSRAHWLRAVPDAFKFSVLRSLYRTQMFEQHLGRAYPSSKIFGIEGAESLIIALETVLDRAADLGYREVVLGMAHRGRLNVLANVMDLPLSHLHDEFDGRSPLGEAVVNMFKNVDTDGTGRVTAAEIWNFVNDWISSGGSEGIDYEAVEEITEKVMTALDSDGEGRLSVKDFVQGVARLTDQAFAGGDVIYHKGAETCRAARGGHGRMNITLTANPSHLEFVGPVVAGRTRAKQYRLGMVKNRGLVRKPVPGTICLHPMPGDGAPRKQVLPVVIHGDAAFSAQGVVSETFCLSDLREYSIGGTVHIVVNNQIGFTTSPQDMHSSSYSTDVARSGGAPIFHVNNDDPLSVAFCAEKSLEYRHTFSKDIVIDLVSFRRHGHNELDVPEFTQPVMYREIKNHPGVAEMMAAEIVEEGLLTWEDVDHLKEEINNELEESGSEIAARKENHNVNIDASSSNDNNSNNNNDDNSSNNNREEDMQEDAEQQQQRPIDNTNNNKDSSGTDSNSSVNESSNDGSNHLHHNHEVEHPHLHHPYQYHQHQRHHPYPAHHPVHHNHHIVHEVIAGAGLSSDLKQSTGVDVEELVEIADILYGPDSIPEGFSLHPDLARKRAANLNSVKMSLEKPGFLGIDWATAEKLAVGTLLRENMLVRLAGQDSNRGTFSQRHTMYFDQVTGCPTKPFDSLDLRRDGIGYFDVVNSPVSEVAPLAFEYGFSLECAEGWGLTMWEAQFGDFCNVAQPVIDTFIANGEAKWGQLSGVVMLLPHGLQGQGPDHSSARLERFLQLHANRNITVCNLTSPANYFHILRRQAHMERPRPLIILTPKWLLHHRRAWSNINDLGLGSSFRSVIGDPDIAPVFADDDEYGDASPYSHDLDDPSAMASRNQNGSNDSDGLSGHAKDPSAITRIVLMTGRVYHRIRLMYKDQDLSHVALIRIERIAPFPDKHVRLEVARFRNAKKIVWCQEEPMNMGAWTFVRGPLAMIAEGDSSNSNSSNGGGGSGNIMGINGLTGGDINDDAAGVKSLEYAGRATSEIAGSTSVSISRQEEIEFMTAAIGIPPSKVVKK